MSVPPTGSLRCTGLDRCGSNDRGAAAIATAALLGPSLSSNQTPVRLPDISPSMILLVSGQEPIGQLFVRAGCAVCHRIPGIEGAEGRVGPKWVLRTSGPKRLADPRYRGQAKTVREYVIESLLNPGIYVVPGYQDKVMPRWYGKKLSAAALGKTRGLPRVSQ